MFNPARLRLARHRQGFTMKELAALCKVSSRSISAWESGAAEPKREAQLRLAEVLKLPAAFLERDDPVELLAEDVSFRALSAMTARERDTALAAGVMAFELDAWLSARFAGPAVDVPYLPDCSAEDAAKQVRLMWNLGDIPVSKVIHLVEAHGVRVYSLIEGTRRLDAYAVWKYVPFVFLNTNKPAERGRFDIAHELGHLVMHKGLQTVRNRKYELEADRFAGAFLMPASGMYARAPRRTTLDFAMQEKHHWGVPAISYVHRLHELHLISDWHYRSYCIELTQRGYRLEEPDGRQPESSLLLAKMFQLLRDSNVSMRQVALDLDLTESAISQLVFGLVLAALPGVAPDGRAERTRNHLSLL